MRIRITCLLFPLLLPHNFRPADARQNGAVTEKDIEKYRLDAKTFEKVKTIHVNWYVHSVKALMVQLSKQLLPKLGKELKADFLACLAKINDKKDIVSGARCVISAKDRFEAIRAEAKARRKTVLDKLPIRTEVPTRETGEFVVVVNQTTSTTSTTTPRSRLVKFRRPKLRKSDKKSELLEKYKKFKSRRILELSQAKAPVKLELPAKFVDNFKTETRKSKLKSKSKSKSASKNLRKLTAKYRMLMGTKGASTLENRFKRVKRSPYRLVVDSVAKSDSYGYQVKTRNRMPNLMTEADKSPVQRITGLMNVLMMNDTQNSKSGPRWSETYKNIVALKKKLEEREKSPGARVYNQRMFDLVMDVPLEKSHGMFSGEGVPDLVKKAFDLMGTIDKSGRNGGMMNYKFLSPRFASVMPDKSENRGKLSPSILSFYNDESEDQVLPIPKLLEATGLNPKDRESVIEMAMELSGARNIVEEALKMLKAVDMPELDAAVSDNAKKTLAMVDDIKNSFSGRQKKAMKKEGFTVMDPAQLRKFMTEQGISDRKDLIDVDAYEKKSVLQRKEMVWDVIRSVAFGAQAQAQEMNELAGNGTLVRRKRQDFGPHILTPTILTTPLFAPVYGLAVLAPTILSPGLFTPLLLNPAVLSPYIFSPTVGIPFILSPYLLSPYIFSPLVMAPFILNPYVLSPNLFNPYVLSPLVLSPLVLCPDVVSPMVLGGVVLSPGVLSPSIISKSFLMANVLSPTILS